MAIYSPEAPERKIQSLFTLGGPNKSALYTESRSLKAFSGFLQAERRERTATQVRPLFPVPVPCPCYLIALPSGVSAGQARAS